MAEISMTRIATALGALRRLERFGEGSLDGRPVAILDSRVHASPQGIRLAVTFRLDEHRHQVEAEHDWEGGRDVVRVDGRDVEKRDADLHFSLREGEAELEYRLWYERQGEHHRLALDARVGL